jgi:hypothetical protein
MPRVNQPASIQDQLIADEHILWEGAPSISFFHFLRLKFTRYMIIIYIVAIVFLIGYVQQKLSDPANMMPILMAGLFIGMGFIVYIPYVLFDNFREYRRYGIGRYAVTDKRILVQGKAGVTSLPINAIPSVTKLDEKNGLGTIQFQTQGFPILYRIKDANMVYKLINDLRAKST